MPSFRILTTLALAVAAVSAAPAPAGTSTTQQDPSKTVSLTGVTHSVVAGLGGLHFDPDNVVAEVGDVVEWHFLPANHTVAQSSFGEPCQPLADGSSFFAGFNFATKECQAADVFQIVVKDTKPIWYYCAQQKGNHCQAGMAGVINQNFNSPNTLAAYKAAAAKTTISIIPPVVKGGKVIANPNPLGGF